MKMVPFKVTQQGDHIGVMAQGKEYTPPEISAMIPAKAEEVRRSLSRRDGDRGGHHRSGVLQ